MKEKTPENVIVKLIHMCGLGKITAAIEPVSGGLMHRMYKVITDSGVYAVKHLNAEIMKRPGVHENFARAEKIEGILENNDIPIVPDVGMFASFDPVALDLACADAVNKQPVIANSQLDRMPHVHHDHFMDSAPQTNWKSMIEHAVKIGIGNGEYELIEI